MRTLQKTQLMIEPPAPGSPEHASLKERLYQMAGEIIEIPVIVLDTTNVVSISAEAAMVAWRDWSDWGNLEKAFKEGIGRFAECPFDLFLYREVEFSAIGNNNYSQDYFDLGQNKVDTLIFSLGGHSCCKTGEINFTRENEKKNLIIDLEVCFGQQDANFLTSSFEMKAADGSPTHCSNARQRLTNNFDPHIFWGYDTFD